MDRESIEPKRNRATEHAVLDIPQSKPGTDIGGARWVKGSLRQVKGEKETVEQRREPSFKRGKKKSPRAN